MERLSVTCGILAAHTKLAVGTILVLRIKARHMSQRLCPPWVVVRIFSDRTVDWIDCSCPNRSTVVPMTSRWMMAKHASPCAAHPECAGIEPGDWAWFREDGTALHAIGGCKDASGRPIPHMRRDEGGSQRTPHHSHPSAELTSELEVDI